MTTVKIIPPVDGDWSDVTGILPDGSTIKLTNRCTLKKEVEEQAAIDRINSIENAETKALFIEFMNIWEHRYGIHSPVTTEQGHQMLAEAQEIMKNRTSKEIH